MELFRAVFYARCSTEEESQIDALYNQVAECEACIKEQGWFLAGRYVESKSGTSTKGRSEYNRLYEDLLLDKFDIIVIKSQDRLMRNVKDWYLFLDRVLTHKKRLFMYIEQKFYTSDDALMTGIKAILAEEYSRELSKKINNAHKNRQKNGGKTTLTSRVFGFEKNVDGTMSVVEAEAKIIRKIYEYSAAGYGSRTISNILLGGYEKKTGGSLSASMISRMIRNPLYKGIMVLNRLHYDFETKKTIKNPENQWIYKEGMVPAIVDEALWEKANQAMTERAAHFSGNGERDQGKGAKGGIGRHDLSGKIVCGQCGRPYYRTLRRRYKDRDEVIIEWKCSSYLEWGRQGCPSGKSRGIPEKSRKGCDNIHLEEGRLFSALAQVNGQYYESWDSDRKEIISYAVRLLSRAMSQNTRGFDLINGERAEGKIVHQKDILLTKLLDGVISDSDYQKKNERLEKELESLRGQRNNEKKGGEAQALEQRIRKIKAYLFSEGFERAAVLQMLSDIQKIVVYEWNIEICFASSEEADGEKKEKTLEQGFDILVPCPFSPRTERGRYLDREKIVELMKTEPDTTAKKIARDMGRPVRMVQGRIKELRKAGRIRYNGSGGNGIWEVL